MENDLINRQAAIDAIFSEPLYKSGMKKRDTDAVVLAIYEKIKLLPSAQPERKRGRWIEYIPEHGKCPFCGNHVDLLNGKANNFCGECGADMRTKETDYDYERAVEQLEHNMLYEPTFNPDDGSM